MLITLTGESLVNRKSSIIIAFFLSSLSILQMSSPSSASTGRVSGSDQPDPRPEFLRGFSVHSVENGRVVCRSASPEDAAVIQRAHRDLTVHEFIANSADGTEAQTAGLTIIVRGTAQFNQASSAKAAFLRAVAGWQSIIQNPITIFIDVDFAPTCFGEPFPAGTLGLSDFQNTDRVSSYLNVRQRLIAGASNPEERAIYDSLPASSVPTDLGNTSQVFGPTTVFRALGLLNQTQDPEAERPSLGDPPSIGFNSNGTYDFDPSDGIDDDATDFEGLALHEIGHILGFFSMTGIKEEVPSSPLGVSVFDLFRFRPGVTRSAFTSTPRSLSSGGVHLFFAGGPQVQLSTGRANGTGGDGEQGHHWKDNAFTGVFLGIMDPTFDDGEHFFITENDLTALDFMGYSILRGGDAPTIKTMTASLNGDVLTLTGTASDPQGDISRAQVKLLNGGGLMVAQTSPFAVNLGSSADVSFLLTVTNLSEFPTAVQALLLLTDRQNHTSRPLIVSFNQSTPGGPVLNAVSISGRKMKIKGNGLGGSIDVEINGIIVDTIFNGVSKKLVVKGSSNDLNLRSGANRLRVRNGGVFSNIFIFDFEGASG
jgi:hypothetical protein